jgi:hypothetical protein
MKLGIIDVKKCFLMRILSSIFDKFDMENSSRRQKIFPITIINFLPSLFCLLKYKTNLFDITSYLSLLTNPIIDHVYYTALTKFYSNNKLNRILIV